MMNKSILFSSLLSCIMSLSSLCCAQAPSTSLKVDVEQITSDLSLPTNFAEPNDHSGRLFITEQAGRIMILKKGMVQPKPFLDIRDEVLKNNGYDERGLLGLAFHPDFSKNGKFYVYFSSPADKAPGVNHKSVIREYTVSKENPDLADKATATMIMQFNQPEGNHNGGDIKFGPDGYLYIASGDGGGGDDKHGEYGNGQNMNTLLGKILRIDINKQPYAIPKDNPFANKEGARGEIYAFGLRNPWRISFDRESGKLFVGDVGQNAWEEIDIVTKGGNYGWRIREGLHEKFPNDPGAKNWIDPIADYPHSEGISVTGGFVYRGKKIPALKGKYVFGDWMGPVWVLTDQNKSQWVREKLSISHSAGYWQIYSFGEDQSGELYILAVLQDSNKGALFKIVPGK